VGYSAGGSITFEMACQLERQGHAVALLGIIDHSLAASGYERPVWDARWAVRACANVLRNVPFWADRVQHLGGGRTANAAAAHLKLLARRIRRARSPRNGSATWSSFKARASVLFGEYL